MAASSSAVPPAESLPTNLYDLAKENELRIEIDENESISLRLIAGTAEIFGTEIAQEHVYKFSFTNVAVFTWHGCKIEVTGKCHAYVGTETPMVYYINTHAILEERRKDALKNYSITGNVFFGPRVIIVGPMDTGKSSLAKILLSYATRCGQKPIYADLDIGQGVITIPGFLGAVSLDRPINPEEGFSMASPLVYLFGTASLGDNPDLYKNQLAVLASQLKQRLLENPEEAASGMVINTCGWVDGMGYQLLRHAIEVFEADVVLVLDQERLFNDLRQELPAHISLAKLPKSGGVVTRSTHYRRRTREKRVREYFYGPAGDFCPHPTVVNFADANIYRIGGGPQAPLSALPIGMVSTYDPLRLAEVKPHPELEHSVLAVCSCSSPQGILSSNVLGYLYVTNVDMDKQKFTFLAPSPGPLPSRYLVAGALKWLE